MSLDGAFLLSVDLEDLRALLPDGARYRDRLAANTHRYLELLDRHGMRCTFFTVGNVARSHPDLVREIAARGHELACHTSDHVPVSKRDAASLRDDLKRNLDDLSGCASPRARGFRAPVHSLTPATAWAYEVLAELGFHYSSSVLPGWNPRGGWPSFGSACRETAAGIFELPVSVPGRLGLPFVGGGYFRLLPLPLLRRLYVRTLRRGAPVVGYLHPFDVDTEQERYDHPQLRGSRLLEGLLFHNRAAVIDRLDALLAEGGAIEPYGAFVARRRAALQ